VKMSIREIGASGGAAGVVLCAYTADAPIPTAHPTSSTPLNLLKTRESMRLSSATIFGSHTKNWGPMQDRPESQQPQSNETDKAIAVSKVPYFNTLRARFIQ
jgi:hypothetical protein